MSKTITAFFGPGQRSVKTDPLFQWDDGVILKFSGLDLPDTFAVDFSNSTSGEAKKRNTGNSDGVLVPAEVFTSGTEIYAWPVGTDEIGSHTEAVVVIPLDRRARPAGALPPGPQDDDAKTIITEAVNAWMDAHAGEMGGGISEAIKNALLQLAEHVAYIDEHGQDYYDDLEAALNYVKDLTAISAQFSQGEAVIYDTDTLDTLRRYLAVVAQYNDSTSELVTNYTLSGVLQSGTSSITAEYGGKTDSFDVQVTHYDADLSSITAVYTQSGTVYDTDTLDSLKADLVVTAVYSDSSTQTVPAADYTLSGTLTVGTSTIAVSYGGKTDTFTVAVSTHKLFEVSDTAISKSNPCINTEIQLLNTDIDFTILFDGTQGNAVTTGYSQRLLTCISDIASWKGVFVGGGNNNGSYNIQWYSGPSLDIGVDRTSTNKRMRIAYRHENGSNKAVVACKVNDGNINTLTISSNFISNGERPLYVGGSGPNANENWEGTINKCTVYDSVLSDAEINEFFA